MLSAHAAGWIESSAAEDAITLLNENLPEMNANAFVVLPVTTYLGYSALMGLVLLAGVIVGFTGRIKAMLGVYGYCILFALMFINYKTMNIKLAHLAITLVFAIVLHILLLKGRGNTSRRTQEETK